MTSMKLVMLCWNCGKEHKPRALSSFDGPYLCECGGYVVSPSGKVQLKAKVEQEKLELERLKIRDELLEQLRAQIKYYFGGDGGLAKLQDGVNKLLQERQKLIGGLLTIADIASEDGVHWKLDRCYTTARDILKEIGVTVEWQKSANDMWPTR